MYLLFLSFVLTAAFVNGQPSDQDILTVSAQIWEDGKANFFSEEDCQYNPNGPILFPYVNEARLTGTYASFLGLFDDFQRETGIEEVCPIFSECENKRYAFMREVVATPPMVTLRNFVGQYDSILAEEFAFQSYLYTIWFGVYSRSDGTTLDSSGFEHVFLGELDVDENPSDQLKGFHNWIQAYREEQAGNFVFSDPLTVCEPNIPKFSMTWYGRYKPVCSMFVRTSPEIELALYSLCWTFRRGSICDVMLDGFTEGIQTYDYFCDNDFGEGDHCIASAYPRCQETDI